MVGMAGMRAKADYVRTWANCQRKIHLWTENSVTYLNYRMTHLEHPLPSHEDDYIAFINIHTRGDASNFLESRAPNPVGKSYFTPADYIWEVMPLKAELIRSHRQWLFSPWGFLNLKDKKMYDAQFRHRHSIIQDAISHEMDYTGAWVNSRYDIPRDSYLEPIRFSQGKLDDDWDRQYTLDYINFPYIDYKYVKNIRYYWKKVNPGLENSKDGRRHAILMDIETQEEAPLLAGMKPYMDVESITKY